VDGGYFSKQSFCLGRFYGRRTEVLSHQPTHLKFYRSLCWNLNTLKSLGILCYSGGSCSGLKDTEVSEFQTVILTQFPNNLIKECLDYALYCYSFCLCTFRNSVDKFFLCNCCHRLPHFRKEQLGNWILFTLERLQYKWIDHLQLSNNISRTSIKLKTPQLTIQQRLLNSKEFLYKISQILKKTEKIPEVGKFEGIFASLSLPE